MPEYIFDCFVCGKEYTLEKKISEIFTEEQLKCKKKKCNGSLIRNYKKEMKPTIIPEEFKSVNQKDTRKMNYTKGPSVKDMMNKGDN